MMLFLDGKQEKLIAGLRKEMERSAESLEFERAAVFRDHIRASKASRSRSASSAPPAPDKDVIAFARRDGEACVQVFFIREGKLLGREHYMLEGTANSEPGEIMGSFMGQFYDEAAYVPPNILVQHDVSDADVIRAGCVRRGAPRSRSACHAAAKSTSWSRWRLATLPRFSSSLGCDI